MSFSEYETALKARDAIKSLVKDEINEQRPRYRYGIVTSLSPDENKATVKLNGEESSVPVAMGAVIPKEVGQTVRVNGMPGDRYIEDVYGEVEVPGQPPPDDGTVNGIPIGSTIDPPTDLILTTGSLEEDVWIDASWTAPDTTDISGYDVELARQEGVSFELAQTFRVGTTSLRMAGLRPATNYGVRVATINRIGVRSIYLPSSGYQLVITTVDDTIPAVVTGVAIAAGFKTVTITWTETADRDVARGSGQYEVHLDTSTAFGVSKKIAYTSGTVISIGDLLTGTEYFARVRAIDNSGNFGDWSAVVSDTTGKVIAVDLSDASVTTAALANGAVDNDKLAALAVEAANLADSSVTSTKIANLAVGSAAIANLAVGTAHIADAAIIEAKIGNLAVTTAKIDNLAVNNAKIAALAVDDAKIASLSAGKITAGFIHADRIQVNSLSVEKLQSSDMSTVNLTITGTGAIKVGSPPTDGLIINSQGLRLYQGGAVKVVLDNTGNASFTGNISASTITGGTITGATVRTAASGQRVAFEAGVISKLKFYSGDPIEATPGEVNVGVFTGVTGRGIEIGIYAPKAANQAFGGIQSGSENVVGGDGYVQLQVHKSDGSTKGFFRLVGSEIDIGALAELAYIDRYDIYPGGATSPSLVRINKFSTETTVVGLLTPQGSGASICVYNGIPNKLIVSPFDGNGSASIQATSFDLSSTERIKINITDAPSALGRVRQARVVNYKKKIKEDSNELVDNRTRWGLIAEEVFHYFPEAVSLDANGKPVAIDIGTLVGLLLKSVQELDARIS